MNEKDEAAGALVREKILDEKLERFAKTAMTLRQHAWELLKQTRNPEYVSLRYEIPVEKLRAALESMPNEEPLHKRLARRGAHSRRDAIREDGNRPGGGAPENGGAPERPGSSGGGFEAAVELARTVAPSRCREPGEDDE